MQDNQISGILRQFFDKKKKENKGVSIRGLAQKLSISSSYLHQILKGERVGTPAVYETLCRLLDVDPEKRDFVLNQALRHKGLLQAVSPGLRQESFDSFQKGVSWTAAPKKDFKFLKEWFYVPVMECTRLRDYDGSAAFVARKLGLGEAEAARAMSELQEAGYLVLEDGRLRKAAEFLDFNSAHNKGEIREFHRANMELAQAALDQKTSDADVEKRLITSFTFTCKDDDVAVVRQKISGFLQQLSREHAAGDGDHVYQLAIQFFQPEGTVKPSKKS